MNAKHKRFVEEYLIDQNATQAAIRAGYSKRCARQQGTRLLSNASVSEAIKKGRQKISEKAQVSAEWTLDQLVENHQRAREEGNLAQSNKALELIGKTFGMFTDKVQQTGPISVQIVKPDRGK